MTQLRLLKGLSDCEADYDILLCDIWGVLHNGRDVFLPAFEALRQFKSRKKSFVVLISNSPRPFHKVYQQITEILQGRIDLSLKKEVFYDAIITSGDASSHELSRLAPGPAFKLGPSRDDPLYEGLGLIFSDLKSAEFISCTGLFDEERETVENYKDLLREARDRNLPMVCVNPDLYVQKFDRLVPCGGMLAAHYEYLGGKVIYAGKPHPPIYQLAYEKMKASGFQQKAEINKKRVLAIGDGIKTDIAGACREGVDSLYITQGLLSAYETFFEVGHNTKEDVVHIDAQLKKQGFKADYVMPGLQW